MEHMIKITQAWFKALGPGMQFLVLVVSCTAGFPLFLLLFATVISFIIWDTSVFYDVQFGVTMRFAFVGGLAYASLRGFCTIIIPIIDPRMKELIERMEGDQVGT